MICQYPDHRKAVGPIIKLNSSEIKKLINDRDEKILEGDKDTESVEHKNDEHKNDEHKNDKQESDDELNSINSYCQTRTETKCYLKRKRVAIEKRCVANEVKTVMRK
jgi:hypothetical protein